LPSRAAYTRISSALVLAVAAWLIAGVAPSGQGRNETPTFHHLHLNAADPQAAVRFYEQQFPTTAGAESVAGFSTLKSGQVLLLFTKATRPSSPPPQSAYWHFGWHVPSAQGYWERYRATLAPLTPLHTDDGGAVTFSNEWLPGTLTKAAVTAARASGKRPHTGGYGYLTGPDGASIEFAGDMPTERFNHVHMFQEDVFCAELWYARHLNAPLSGMAKRATGRKTSEADCRVPQGEPSWLSLVPEGTIRVPAGGVVFGDVELNWYQRQGAAPLAPSGGGVMDHVGLQVRDLDRWVARLRQDGVHILKDPYRFGKGWAALIEGPSREAIELVEIP
jgi:catechol 2,3-dioxygenase-like lactoylglutathione lyase family enzyme